MAEWPSIGALVLLAAGAGLILVYVRAERNERRRAAGRVDRAIKASGVRATGPPGKGPRDPPQAWLSWPRMFFSLGLARNWGVTLSARSLCLLSAAGAAAAWLLSNMLLHLPVWMAAPCAIGAAFFVPQIVMRHQQRRAEGRFSAAFPDAIDMIVRMMRAGLPVVSAIRAIGGQASPEVAGVFIRIADHCDIGMPVEQVLSNIAEELNLDDFRFFAITVGLQRSTGGNLTRTLETFSDILRKRRAVQLRANAATAEVRMSATILSAIPFLVVGALAIVNPGYLAPLFSTPSGNILLGAAIACLLMGAFTMRWMIQANLE